MNASQPTPKFPVNQAKQALKDGRSLIGVMVVEFRQPSIMQVLEQIRQIAGHVQYREAPKQLLSFLGNAMSGRNVMWWSTLQHLRAHGGRNDRRQHSCNYRRTTQWEDGD